MVKVYLDTQDLIPPVPMAVRERPNAAPHLHHTSPEKKDQLIGNRKKRAPQAQVFRFTHYVVHGNTYHAGGSPIKPGMAVMEVTLLPRQ